MNGLPAIRRPLARWLRGRPGSALRLAGGLFTAGVAGWVIHEVIEVGWLKVVESLPATPWFYLIFSVMYLASPLSEVIIFRRLWGPVPGLFPAVLMRRLCSGHVIDYSGEAWLYLWARRRPGLPHARVVHGIKDNVILSSAVSTLFAAAVLGALAAGGWLVPGRAGPGGAWIWLLAAPAVLAVLVAAGRALRRPVLSAPPSTAAVVCAAHLGRHAAVHVLQVCLWVVVEPSVSLGSWLTLLAAQIVLTRIPFLPGRDLVFVSAGLGLSGYLNVESAVVAGILLTTAVLDRGLNLVLYLACRWSQGRRGASGAEPAPAPGLRAATIPPDRCRAVGMHRDSASPVTP